LIYCKVRGGNPSLTLGLTMSLDEESKPFWDQSDVESEIMWDPKETASPGRFWRGLTV